LTLRAVRRIRRVDVNLGSGKCVRRCDDTWWNDGRLRNWLVNLEDARRIAIGEGTEIPRRVVLVYCL
jgi:hypothetical protein